MTPFAPIIMKNTLTHIAHFKPTQPPAKPKPSSFSSKYEPNCIYLIIY